MADLNKVMFIGRLASDPVMRTFPNTGGKVAKFRFAVTFTRSKKNPTTGQWEGGESAFIDVEAFNNPREGTRQMADLVEKYLKKGNQVYIEGRLRQDTWEKEGQKQYRLLIVADNLQFLEGRGDGGEGYGQSSRVSAPPFRQPTSSSGGGGFEEPDAGFAEPPPPPSEGGSVSDLPF